MRNATRLLYNAYVSQIAMLNGIEPEDATTKFTVAPSVQQTLEQRIQESSDFLNRINITGVDEMKGETLGLGITGTIASTTNTAVADRQTQDPTGLDDRGYELFQTNFDTHLTYGKLDAWAKFPNFQELIRDLIIRGCALDRMRIGFNGVTRAATSNRVNNPLLQDVNKGWLQHLREGKSEHVLDEVTANSGKVTYGAAGNYKTLDALVYDIVNSVLPVWARGDTELVAIVGRGLLHDKYFPMVNQVADPSEQLARDVIMSTKRLGGLPAVQVPFFPEDAVLVTRLDNLSIYYQNEKRRRTIVDNAKRDRIENYESSNEAYVIEDFDYAVMAENIEEKQA